MANGSPNSRIQDLKTLALILTVVAGLGGLVWSCFSFIADTQSKSEAREIFETKANAKEQRTILRKQIDDSVMRIESTIEKQAEHQEKLQDNFQKEWRQLRREIRGRR